MRRSNPSAVVWRAFAAAALAGSPVLAQSPCIQYTQPYRPCPTVTMGAPSAAAPSATAPSTTGPMTAAPAESPSASQPNSTAPTNTAAPNFGDLASGAGIGATASLAPAGGYIDNAVPYSGVRIRYDAGFGMNRPDRGEFFYPKCGCFPGAPGPGVVSNATNVDFQEVQVGLEAKIGQRASVFVEAPWRWVSFTTAPGTPAIEATNGYSDTNVGFKYAFLLDDAQAMTLQVRTYIPTGVPSRGLGTNHVSIEPALLWFNRVNDKLNIEAEVRDWISIGGTDFAGNVLRYGIGANYEVFRNCSLSVRPAVELVGWTFLSGREFTEDGIAVDATGDSILNAKVGVRTFFGDRSSLYVGYGRSLTGDVLYRDIARIEYRLMF